MMPLLRSTENGRHKLNRTRHWTALILTYLAFITAELPLFLRYQQTGVLQCLDHRLAWFSSGDYTSPCTIGFMIITIFAFKVLSYLTVCFMGELLARYTKNGTVTLLAGVGAVGVVAALLFGIKMDITTIMLKIMA